MHEWNKILQNMQAFYSKHTHVHTNTQTHMPFVQYMCTKDGQNETLGQFSSVELITENWAASVTQVIKSLWNM
jgi:hypothetical protein